ncbi:aldo/keto reductase, partial [Motilimonas pumila]
MIRRELGTSGIETPPLILGGNVFGWTADRAISFAVLDRFAEAGGALIDTADVYSAWVPGQRGGESAAIIGEWLRTSGKHGKVKVATKVGMLDGEGGYTVFGKLFPARDSVARGNLPLGLAHDLKLVRPV